LERFPTLVTELKSILERFMTALSSIDQCFISDKTLDESPKSSVVGRAKVGGIDFNKQRMRLAAQAVLALAASAGQFTASDLAQHVCSSAPQTAYGPRRGAYDLKKMHAKKMVQRIGKSRRYQATAYGLQVMAALVAPVIVVQPILAATINRKHRTKHTIQRLWTSATLRCAHTCRISCNNLGWPHEYRKSFCDMFPLRRPNPEANSPRHVSTLSLDVLAPSVDKFLAPLREAREPGRASIEKWMG
jgi:hypothetical protein